MLTKGISGRFGLKTVLIVVGVFVCLLSSRGVATAGVYADSAMGNPSYGVHRSGAGYATGDCAHCHERFDTFVCGVNNYSLFCDDWVSQDDLLCVRCHSDSDDPQQVYNDTYSANFGGGPSLPEDDTVKEQFNYGTAEHELSAIRDLIGNDAYGWDSGLIPIPVWRATPLMPLSAVFQLLLKRRSLTPPSDALLIIRAQALQTPCGATMRVKG